MSVITTTVDVYVQDVLDQLDDDELIEEVERRGLDASCLSDIDEPRNLLVQIWMKRRTGQDYSVELDRLIYCSLGKII